MKKIISLIFLNLLCAITLIGCDQSDDLPMSVQSDQDSLLKSNQGIKGGADENCTSIQSGTLLDENGEYIQTGFNDQGYNYLAHIYNGEMYPDTYPGWNLSWKWNEAYLSTQDCNGDQLLDIANGQENYRGTGAWTTTTWTRTYTNSEGKKCRVSQFTKYVAVPADATSDGSFFYNPDGSVIGDVVNSPGFEDFARIQLVWNDPCQGVNGIDYKAPGPVGLGNR